MWSVLDQMVCVEPGGLFLASWSVLSQNGPVVSGDLPRVESDISCL